MKKAVIQVGSKQYLVSEGSKLDVSLPVSDAKKLTVPALLVIDGDKTTVGVPETDSKVELELLESFKAEKVTAIRYKAKKRVLKVRGHRQQLMAAKVSKIS
jgi:large subunit ribosomal protein L21